MRKRHSTEFTDWKQGQSRCDMVDAAGDYPAVFGFDFGRGFDNQLEAVKAAAKMGGIITISDHVRNPHNPKPALTEFGYRGGIQNNSNLKWFTEIFLSPILNSEKARRVVFALTWSNGSKGYWVPTKDDPTHEDFVEFHSNLYTLFLKEWRSTRL